MAKNTVYVRNLPFKMTEEELHDLFKRFGKIKEVKIATEHGSERPLGYGFVEFTNPESAEKAVATMDTKECAVGEETRCLSVKIADESKRRGRGGRW
jgi:RNA recognition motif-containing protein